MLVNWEPVKQDMRSTKTRLKQDQYGIAQSPRRQWWLPCQSKPLDAPMKGVDDACWNESSVSESVLDTSPCCTTSSLVAALYLSSWRIFLSVSINGKADGWKKFSPSFCLYQRRIYPRRKLSIFYDTSVMYASRRRYWLNICSMSRTASSEICGSTLRRFIYVIMRLWHNT